MEEENYTPEPDSPDIFPEIEYSAEGDGFGFGNLGGFGNGDMAGNGNGDMAHDHSPSPDPYDPEHPYGWDDSFAGPLHTNGVDDLYIEIDPDNDNPFGLPDLDLPQEEIQQLHDRWAATPGGHAFFHHIIRPRLGAVPLRPDNDGDYTGDTTDEEMDEDEDDWDDYDEDAHEFGDEDAILRNLELQPTVLPVPPMQAIPPDLIGAQFQPYVDIWSRAGQVALGDGPSDADIANPPADELPLFHGYSSESHDEEGSPVMSDAGPDGNEEHEEYPPQGNPGTDQGVQGLNFIPEPPAGYTPTRLTSPLGTFNPGFLDQPQRDEFHLNLVETFLSTLRTPDLPTVAPPDNESGESEAASSTPEADRRVFTSIDRSTRNQRAFQTRRRYRGYRRAIGRYDQLIAECHQVIEDPSTTSEEREHARVQCENLVGEVNEMRHEIGSPPIS